MLDLDRIESGRDPLTLAELDVASLVEHARDTMHGQAEDHGVIINLDVQDRPKLVGDADKLLQVLTNLLSNAIKFSPQAGTVTLLVGSNGDKVQFDVRDQGRGIPPDMREAIFEPFRQVERADRTEKHGSGLGLAISRSIIAQHHGRIWVDSEPDHGSVFHIELPRQTTNEV